MKTLTIRFPTSVNVDLENVEVSEALGELILGLLHTALRLPEETEAYVQMPGERCIATAE